MRLRSLLQGHASGPIEYCMHTLKLHCIENTLLSSEAAIAYLHASDTWLTRRLAIFLLISACLNCTLSSAALYLGSKGLLYLHHASL